MSDADDWGEPEPFGEDEDSEPVLWNCPNPDCSTQKDTKAKAAAHCADADEPDENEPGAAAERDETLTLEADKTTVQNEYYQQNGLVDVSTTLGRLDIDGLPSAQCLGNHDFVGWYQTRPETDVETIEDGFDGRGTVYALADDYTELASEIDRVLYATTNYQDPDALEWRLYANAEDGKEWEDGEKPTPGYEDILGFSILADIDLSDEHKERPLPSGTRETVESAITEYADSFALLTGGRAHVFALDSVGGVYLLTPPAATAPLARAFDGDDRQRVFEELRQRADAWLNDVRDDVNAAVPGAEGVFEADLLNQKNRLYKAPLSIHSSIDGVVHPLDIETGADAPAYEFVPVEDVSRGLVDETAMWAAEFTRPDHTDAVEHIVARLWPEYVDESDDWQAALEAWITDEREREAEQRRKAQQAAEERAQRAEERDESLPAFTDATGTDSLGIATNFDDVQAAVDRVDPQQVVRRLCDEYDTDPGRDPPRFEPTYRTSDSGTSCFVDREKIIDLDDEYSAIGVLDYVARERGYIGETDTATGEHRAKARNDLRDMGFEIPVYTPVKGSKTYDGEEFDEMPARARAKAAVALGVCDPDDVTDGWKLSPTHHDALLDILEKQGIEHGCSRLGDGSPDPQLATADGGAAAADGGAGGVAGGETGGGGDDADSPDPWSSVRTLYAADDDADSKSAMNWAVRLANDDFDIATHDESEALFVYDPEDGIYHRQGDHRVQEYLNTDDRLGLQFYPARARNIIETLRYTSYTPEREFGAPADRICVANGVLDVSDPSDPVLRSHDPDHLFTDRHPVEYDPDAECPEFMDFLDQSVRDEDRKKLQEYAGYLLHTWNQPYKKAMMLVGPTNSGKGTFLRIIEAVVGRENISNETLEDLTDSRWAAAQLYEGVANIRNEMSTSHLKHTERFKEMTGGGDRMAAEFKHQNKFEFTVTQKFLFATNEVPAVEGDDAFNKRWLFAAFPTTVLEPEIDPDLDSRIIENELSGVLNWMLDGYGRLREKGRFSNERGIEDKEEMWERFGSTVDRFKQACLDVTGDDDDTVVKKEAYELYTAFCGYLGQDSETQQKLTTDLKGDENIGDARPRIRGSKTPVYTGVAFDGHALDELDVASFGPDDDIPDNTQQERLGN